MDRSDRFFRILGIVAAIYIFAAGLADVSFRAVVPFVRDVRAMVED